MSLSRFYGSFAPVITDARLKSLDIAGFNSAEELVFHLFVRGSVVQCAALLDHLDATCDLAVPEMSAINRNVAQEAIISGITQCCDFLGVNFAGDLPVFAATAFDMYKGLSILEWMRFFDGVRKGRWKSDYQNVSVRGLNPEFMLDWLEKFGEQRDHVVQSLRREIPDRSSGDVDVSGLEKFKEMQKREAIIASRVHEYRSTIDQARKVRMVESRKVPMENGESVVFSNRASALRADIKRFESQLSEAQKSGTVDRIKYLEEQIDRAKAEERDQSAKATASMTWVEEDFVFEGDAPGANYQRLEETLRIYYCTFHPEKPIKDLMDTIMVRWELEHLAEGHSAETLKAFYNTEAKKLNQSLRAIEIDPTGMLMAGLTQMLDKSTSPAIFLENIGISSPGATRDQVVANMRKIAQRIENAFTSEKYCQHVEKAFDGGKIPLYKNEYKTYCALWVYVNTCGCEHPFFYIFND